MRTFQAFDIEEVKQHLLIQGDLSSDCASCRALGIDSASAKNCPQCGTVFKYISSRRFETHPGERFRLVRRMQEKRPDLKVIDYVDYSNVLGVRKAKNFFG